MHGPGGTGVVDQRSVAGERVVARTGSGELGRRRRQRQQAVAIDLLDAVVDAARPERELRDGDGDANPLHGAQLREQGRLAAGRHVDGPEHDRLRSPKGRDETLVAGPLPVAEAEVVGDDLRPGLAEAVEQPDVQGAWHRRSAGVALEAALVGGHDDDVGGRAPIGTDLEAQLDARLLRAVQHARRREPRRDGDPAEGRRQDARGSLAAHRAIISGRGEKGETGAPAERARASRSPCSLSAACA